MIDGRGKKTSLARLIATQTGVKTQEDIIRALYKENFDIASVTPLVIRAAQKKDRTAVGILDDAASELVDVIKAAVERMNKKRRTPPAQLHLAFIGSLLSNDNIYSKKVRSLIRRRIPQIAVQKPIAPPVHGAVIMSINSLKVATTNR
jgi:N-acetylglucosamine kinase-like BadF-type ATPase